MKTLRLIAVYGEMERGNVAPEVVRHKDLSPLLGNVLALESWQYEALAHDLVAAIRIEATRQEMFTHETHPV
jgi:hypothetical protein